jgi:hypothetical protein
MINIILFVIHDKNDRSQIKQMWSNLIFNLNFRLTSRLDNLEAVSEDFLKKRLLNKDLFRLLVTEIVLNFWSWWHCDDSVCRLPDLTFCKNYRQTLLISAKKNLYLIILIKIVLNIWPWHSDVPDYRLWTLNIICSSY